MDEMSLDMKNSAFEIMLHELLIPAVYLVELLFYEELRLIVRFSKLSVFTRGHREKEAILFLALRTRERKRGYEPGNSRGNGGLYQLKTS